MLRGRTSTATDSKTTELKAKIKPGSIIRIFCDFIKDPKIKHIVIAYIDFEEEASLVFIINSEIPPFIENDAYLKSGQIALEKTSYAFFPNNCSYLNCVEDHAGLDLEFLLSHLLKTPNEYKGELLDKEINKVISFVKNAQTIPPTDIELIIKSLGNNKSG